ncbi:MAG: hypothetical protein HDT43_07505 [Ruminococcaceae bacterium]|nr:hypothetical protein [Oscillospiraceae bacterium]
MSKLLHANFARMFGSVEFMACTLFSLGFGLLNFIFSCILNVSSYHTTFERDLFNMSKAVIVIAAVFVSLFFGTENSVVRNRLMVGHSRGAVYAANWLTAFCGVFVINALSMLPYTLAAPFFDVKVGDITVDELMLNVLIEILAVAAAGGIYFLITVIITRRSVCAVGALVTAIILLYLPEMGGNWRYSPGGQLNILLNREYTTAVMPLCSLGLLAVSTAVGAVVFGRKDLK